MRRMLCLLLALVCALLSACGAESAPAAEESPVGEMALAYAGQFRVSYYAGGAALLQIADQRLLLLPDGAETPRGLERLPSIPIPVERVYLASSSAADLFLQLGALDSLRCTSTDEPGWRIPELRQAVRDGRLLYAGKYSAPDYELLLEESCDLVLENTMILHAPETREKLEALGFPVLLEYSSYEPHPLGRVEWIKLYGLLTGRLDEAEAFFARQEQLLSSMDHTADSGRSVAFFHLNTNGSVVVRRQADYVTRMIELAGGRSVFTDLPEAENALSTVNIQMEAFYAQARDADVLIYNSTIAGELETLEDFLRLNPLLEDFRAVREGRVWCTEQSMFQRSSAAAGIIADFYEILQDAPREETLRYLHRLN